MASSIQSVLLFGYGNGTISGATDLVITLGFGIASVSAPTVVYDSWAAPPRIDWVALRRKDWVAPERDDWIAPLEGDEP